jgi:hypothetical protein
MIEASQREGEIVLAASRVLAVNFEKAHRGGERADEGKEHDGGHGGAPDRVRGRGVGHPGPDEGERGDEGRREEEGAPVPALPLSAPSLAETLPKPEIPRVHRKSLASYHA